MRIINNLQTAIKVEVKGSVEVNVKAGSQIEIKKPFMNISEITVSSGE